MIVTGIIAEFNPFHNGHKYILDRARKETSADYIVVVMSGNHTQRGMLSILDKYKRTECALRCGADLVLELPVSYATATAETFAFGGVSILDSIEVTDKLVFGTECGDLQVLNECAKTLDVASQKCKIMKNEIVPAAPKISNNDSLSYPAARAKAYPQYEDILREPNNILALEYLKALMRLDSNIEPLVIERMGAGYHEEKVGALASAQGIRSELCKPKDAVYIKQEIEASLPRESYEYLCQMLDMGSIMTSSDYDMLLKYALLNNSAEQLSQFQDVNEDIAHRILKIRDQKLSFDDIIMAVKSKNLTYTRISRALLHIMLRIKDSTRDEEGELKKVPYTQVLGFRKNASSLLHVINDNTSIPIITKAADYKQLLDEDGKKLFEDNLRADRIYYSAMANKAGHELIDPLRISPVIIE